MINLFRSRKSFADANDETLVMCSLGGDRDAFGVIVNRYQNLLCSLAYSSIGDLKHSEDIAQEAFVEAWKQLDSLREPEKLKAWLCGILRFKVSHFFRKESLQPFKKSTQLDSETSVEIPSETLENDAIDAQQEALMWQTLDKMESTYREPLVLFYRENQSVDQVAKQLDLTQETAKQRLSRGRKLLQSSMITYVENTLKKSRPGVAFTASVLASINLISPPAKAAALGSGAAKTLSLFNIAAVAAIVASLSGLLSSFFGLRASLDQARTQKERKNAYLTVVAFLGIAAVFVIAMLSLQFAIPHFPTFTLELAIISQCVVIAFIVSYVMLTLRMLTRLRLLRVKERKLNPQAFSCDSDKTDAKQREYKSRITLLGVPLVHVRFGTPEQGDTKILGWIAGGDKAYGLLFAWGAVAIAPISVGIISAGIVTVGVIGIGVLGLGTIGIGLVGFGGSAIAYKAYASMSALGWQSAISNGFSVAKDAALGQVAIAEHTNSDQAAMLADLSYFSQSYVWFLALISVFVIVPSAAYAHTVRRRMRNK